MNESGRGSKGFRAVAVLALLPSCFSSGIFLAFQLLVRAPAELAHATAEGFRTLFQ